MQEVSTPASPALDQTRLAALVAELGGVLAQTGSFRDALQHCAQGIIRYLDAALVRIWTFNPATEMLELQVSEGLYTHLDGAHARIPLGAFKIGKIAEEREPHLTNNLSNDPRVSNQEWVKREGLVSFAGFPLLVDDKLAGVLGLFSRHPLPPETLNALASVSTSIAVCIDRKRAEAELRRSEERFRTTFAAAPIGMVLTTIDGLLIETNEAYRRIVGFTAEELAEKNFLTLSHPADLPLNRDLFEQLLSGKIPSYTIEKRYLCKSGNFIWVRATAALQRDSFGVPQDVIGLVEDISDRKRAEQERQRLVDELARSNEELSRFAHVAAHDLQTPLRMIKSYVQLLARRLNSQMNDSTAECMKIILDGANRMEQLINGLLRYAALGQDRPPNAPVCMNGVVTAAISDLQHSITESGAQIKFSDLPTVQGDPIQLLQLLQNLITNGIKYRNASLPPVIQIAAIHDGRSWKFSVKDNGQGISPEYHALIFGLLKRLHGNDVPGTGLGLAICKKIVEQHGGRIWVESQAGAGSTFFFTIPA